MSNQGVDSKSKMLAAEVTELETEIEELKVQNSGLERHKREIDNLKNSLSDELSALQSSHSARTNAMNNIISQQ